MLAILGELCWLQFFKTVYLETSNVRFGSFFQNPVTYSIYHTCSRHLFIERTCLCNCNMVGGDSCSMEEIEGQKPLVRSSRSYTREQKLHVLRWYTTNGKNLYHTCQKFDLNMKTALRWIKYQKAIHDSKKGRKRVSFGRTAEYLEMEEVLYEEYRRLRQRGLKVKGWWFRTREQQLLKSISPGSKLKFSDMWFDGLKNPTKSVYAVLHTKLR